MSTVDVLLQANDRYTAGFPGPRPKEPRLRMAIVTCMDSRLDLFGAMGLHVGEAHLLRNAGGLPTDDVLRSLAISQRALNTREIVVIQHSDCGMEGFDDEAFRTALSESGRTPPWSVPGFDDVRDSVRRSVRTIRDCPWLLHRDVVRGFVFDVATARLEEVS